MRSPISDLAIILNRIDYGEKDRIITLLTANHGKIRAIAKGVRSAKSKLAGGIELFAENELVLLQGKGELYTLTSSKMKYYFGKIAKDIEASMYAYDCLKTVNKLTPDGAGEEYYQSLRGLLSSLSEAEIPLTQIKIWYGLKLLDTLGASPNFVTDTDNKPLQDVNFQYDFDKHCFMAQPNGPYNPNHIKILRVLTSARKPILINNASEDLIESTERLIRLVLAENI